MNISEIKLFIAERAFPGGYIFHHPHRHCQQNDFVNGVPLHVVSNSKSLLHSFSIKLMIKKSKLMNLKWIYVVFSFSSLFFFCGCCFFVLFFCFCFSFLPLPSHFIVKASLVVWFLHNSLFIYYDNYSIEVAAILLHPKWSTIFIKTIKGIQQVNGFKWSFFSKWNFVTKLLILLLLVICCTLTPVESLTQRYNFCKNEYNLRSTLSPL